MTLVTCRTAITQTNNWSSQFNEGQHYCYLGSKILALIVRIILYCYIANIVGPDDAAKLQRNVVRKT